MESIEYKYIRDTFLKIAEETHSEETLKHLKNKYKNKINSQRTFSEITTIRDLVSVLEKRGCLKPDAHMFTEFNIEDKNLFHMIKEYQHSLRETPRIYRNIYKSKSLERVAKETHYKRGCFIDEPHPEEIRPSQPIYLVKPSPYNPTAPSLHEKLSDEILDLICDDIGIKWADLARKLSIKESEIDSMHVKYPHDLSERMRQCLLIFESRTSDKLYAKLLTALSKARRNDLRDIVQNILHGQ